MKKFFSGLLLLLSTIAVAQPLVPKESTNLLIAFPDGPGGGVTTYYRVEKATVYVDNSTTGRRIVVDSPIQLAGFSKNAEIIWDVFKLLPPVPPVDVPVVRPPVIITSDWNKGQYKVLYGANYQREKEELSNGEAQFDFYGQNGIEYPVFGTDKPSTSDAIVMAFPTHSIVNFAGTDFVSAIEMKLIEVETDQVVWHLLDTKGGYHPALRTNARGNNHPDDANRWLKHGRYKLWVKNLSTDARAVQTISFSTTKGIEYFSYPLSPGNENTYDLGIYKLGDEFDMYKLNCNVFTAPSHK